MAADPGLAGPGSGPISVVVAGRTHEADPRPCLAAIDGQRTGAVEVLFVTDGPAPDPPGVDRRISSHRSLVPDLWAEGIRAARGGVVVLTTTSVVPAPGWITAIRAAHARPGRVVGGPIEPGRLVRPVDWAVFFCRYSSYVRPLEPGVEVPGDNASYDARLLEVHRSAWCDGFWEPFVHHEMRQSGVATDMVGDMVVEMQPAASWSSFSRQRFAHGMRHGRNVGQSETRRDLLVRMVLAPAVPVVMFGRVARGVRARRRHRRALVRSTPLLLWFLSCWAAGEAAGRARCLIGRR